MSTFGFSFRNKIDVSYPWNFSLGFVQKGSSLLPKEDNSIEMCMEFESEYAYGIARGRFKYSHRIMSSLNLNMRAC